VPSPAEDSTFRAAAYDSYHCIVIATVVGKDRQQVNETAIATVVGRDCQRVHEFVVAIVVARLPASKLNCGSNSCRERLSGSTRD